MNLPPRFHAVHGRCVAISNNESKARNVAEDDLGVGVAFTDRPLGIDELVCLRMTTPYWPLPEITFGLTSHDPTSIAAAVSNQTWHPILLDVRIEKPNLYISLRSSGELHFWAEDGEYSRCVTGLDVDIPFWLVVQLPPIPATLQLIEARSLEQPPCGYIYNLQPFHFHEVHGRNVRILGDEVYCKRRTRKSWKGAVFTSRPVQVNEKVCFRIDGITKKSDIQIGFTNQDPAAWTSRSSGVISRHLFNKYSFWVKLLENNLYRHALNIHFYVNSYRQIHYGVDGQNFGNIPSGVDITSPFWGTIVISGKYVNIGFANAVFKDRSFMYSPLVDKRLSSMELLSVAESSRPVIDEDTTHTQPIAVVSSAPSTEDKSSECCICNNNQTNAVFLPCRHMCTCYECAQKMCESPLNRKCPICRRAFVKILRIYPC